MVYIVKAELGKGFPGLILSGVQFCLISFIIRGYLGNLGSLLSMLSSCMLEVSDVSPVADDGARMRRGPSLSIHI